MDGDFMGALKVLCKLQSHDAVICETTCFHGAGCSFEVGDLLMVGCHAGCVVVWVGLCLMVEEKKKRWAI